MPARKPLRAVKDDEAPPVPSRPLTVSQAAEKGTQLDLLVAMRARLATAVEDPNTPARDLAALTRRLLEVSRDIAAARLAAEEEAREGVAVPDQEWDAEAL